MAIAMALTVSQTLLAVLQCKELRELCSMFGYKTDLDDLERTASTIRAVLLDADSKLEELSREARDWIDKLKDAVYDVDDLLDEFNTIVQRNKLHEQTDDGKNKMMKKISKKVRRFFSRSNNLIVAFNTSLDVKKIKKKLDAIASDHSKFGLSVNYEPSKRTRNETWSYVNEDRIIGREDEKEAIVGLLLQDQSTFEENVSFVTIVGIGGSGKTALCQIVYGDDRIKKMFELRFWVCVSEQFGVKEILSKMITSTSDQNWGHLGIDQLQKKVREQIQGKRYLLILDDVWCESHEDWVDLKYFLICGGRGSRILVTTRSKLVARATGNHPVYDLNGLSPEDSWRLFAQMAFDNSGQEADAKLIEIGQEIVRKCANVPLSIRVTGSMLYGQDISKWQLFKEVHLSKIRHAKEDTMAILKLSYNHLSPSLKSCFSYCALFPKDYAIRKDLLINLWVANGCIEPEYEGQNIEDIGEENFSILLNRCFFQEIETDSYGDIYRCKMHDLIHDLAQEVAGNELLLWSGGHFDRKLRHLSICETLPVGFFNGSECVAQVKTMRTCLVVHPLKALDQLVGDSRMSFVSNCRYLRVLDLHGLVVKILPSTIGELVHLRYIDLSSNYILDILPNSITKLHNLEVLLLWRCYGLKALPEKLSRLVNLRVLDIDECYNLTHMPGGMDKLTCLHRLTMFVVGKTISKEIKVSHLGDLEALVQLGGNLTVRLGKYLSEFASEVMKGTRYPLIKSRLKSLAIQFFDSSSRGEDEEAVLEGLQPNHHLREIKIDSYKAGHLPSWISTGNSLRNYFPCLVVIELRGLSKLHCLPSMRQLCHLMRLVLDSITNLEYMEEENNISNSRASSSTSVSSLTFFPSLKELRLFKMPKLKGWWRSHNEKPCPLADDDVIGGSRRDRDRKQAESVVVTSANDVTHLVPLPISSSLLSFPCLRELKIFDCPNLTYLPSCPHAQELHLFKKFVPFSFQERCVGKHLITDKIGRYKNYLDEEFSQGVVSLKFTKSEEESMCSTNTIETINFFQSWASSLHHLEISDCERLKRVGRGVFQHLTNLQSLDIGACENLALEDDDDDEWKYLKSLSSLHLYNLPKLINLPKGIQYLIALRSFHIRRCHNLASLPEWLSSLPSLTQLRIIHCDGLTERCRGPNGEDWPKIRHIPYLTLE